MRSAPVLILCLILMSCGNKPVPTTSTTPAADAMEVDTITVSWPGHYADTLPCVDCFGIGTTLWIRSDSTFVLQQRYGDKDSIPLGTIGHWQVVNGLLTVGYAGDKPEFYRYTKDGLLMVDEMGSPFSGDLDHTLDKYADEIGDAIPRMRLKGSFTYLADAQSFKPCGIDYAWPCVGGMDMGEEEGEPLYPYTNVDLQKAYAKAVKKAGDPWTVEAICTMGMGPAMEGDGADEYIFIEREPRSVEGCP